MEEPHTQTATNKPFMLSTEENTREVASPEVVSSTRGYICILILIYADSF